MFSGHSPRPEGAVGGLQCVESSPHSMSRMAPLAVVTQMVTTPTVVTTTPTMSSSSKGAIPKAQSANTTATLLCKIITLQGWLARFSEPDIRRAFLDGRMRVRENSDNMLRSIDIMRSIMLPSPSQGESDSAVAALHGADFFMRLLEGDDHHICSPMGYELPVRKTCKEWSSYLGYLSDCQFWQHSQGLEEQKYPSQSPSTHQQQINDEHGQAESTFPTKHDKPSHRSLHWERENVLMPSDNRPKSPKSYGRLDDIRGSQSDEMNRGFRLAGPNDSRILDEMNGLSLRNKGKRHVSDRYLTPELTEESDGSPVRRPDRHGRHTRTRRTEMRDDHNRSPCTSSNESDHHPMVSKRDFYKVLSNIKQPKEAVSPGIFTGRDGTSLRLFLEDFEKYFDIKYDGSDRQKSQILGQHLGGTAKQAYEAIHGSRVNYSVLRPELLSWYSSERQSLRRKSESEFRKARMMPNDSLKIFAMRLERLAFISFPDTWKERERQLCRKFRKSVPEGFQRILAEGERGLALHGDMRRLGWTGMLKLAETEDRRRRERKEDLSTDSDAEPEDFSVWYSRSACSDAPRNSAPESLSETPPKRVSFDRVFQNSNRGIRRSPPPSRGTNSVRTFGPPLICNWCGRRGHMEDNCWTKSNSCRMCGSSDHSREECINFQQDLSGFRPICSGCGGSHLGQYCPSHALN